jgi:hypothetical protein
LIEELRHQGADGGATPLKNGEEIRAALGNLKGDVGVRCGFLEKNLGY